MKENLTVQKVDAMYRILVPIFNFQAEHFSLSVKKLNYLEHQESRALHCFHFQLAHNTDRFLEYEFVCQLTFFLWIYKNSKVLHRYFYHQARKFDLSTKSC